MIHLRRAIVSAIVSHAGFEAPLEACGLLGVDADRTVRFAYCLTNRDASPAAFTIDPADYFGASRHAERNGWEIRGIFHSHPNGPPVPSATDVATAPSPDWLYLLVSGQEVRAFAIKGNRWQAVGFDVKP